MLSKVLSLHKLSCPQIWNIKQEKEKKWAAGQRSSTRKRLTGKKSEREKQRRHFFVGRTTWKFCSSGDKIRNTTGHQCKVKMSGSSLRCVSLAIQEFLYLGDPLNPIIYVLRRLYTLVSATQTFAFMRSTRDTLLLLVKIRWWYSSTSWTNFNEISTSSSMVNRQSKTQVLLLSNAMKVYRKRLFRG